MKKEEGTAHVVFLLFSFFPFFFLREYLLLKTCFLCSLESRKTYKMKTRQRAFLLTGRVTREAKYRLTLKQDGQHMSFEQHVALKQFQCLPMLGVHHVSSRKAAEKSQPPAAGGSKSASTVEVSVAPWPQAANACLSILTPHCTEDILGTKTRPRHLSFHLASLQIGCYVSGDCQPYEHKEIWKVLEL